VSLKEYNMFFFIIFLNETNWINIENNRGVVGRNSKNRIIFTMLH
jgi:hypothetical protein